MTTLNDFLFPVTKVKATEKTVSAQSYKVLGYFDGKDNEPTVLNNCSERLNLIDNNDVFPVIETILYTNDIEFDKSYRMNEERTQFHAIYIIKKIKGIDAGIDLGNGDIIYITIRGTNSYDGFLEAFASIGLYRVICTNGLTVPYEGYEEKNFTVKGKHTKQLTETFKTLMSKIESFISMNDVIKKRLNVLTDRMVVNYADRVEEVINATKIKPSKEQKQFINDTIMNEANSHYNGKVNDWLIYNGINAYIFKGKDAKGNKSKATPEAKRKVDEKVLAYIMK